MIGFHGNYFYHNLFKAFQAYQNVVNKRFDLDLSLTRYIKILVFKIKLALWNLEIYEIQNYSFYFIAFPNSFYNFTVTTKIKSCFFYR